MNQMECMTSFEINDALVDDEMMNREKPLANFTFANGFVVLIDLVMERIDISFDRSVISFAYNHGSLFCFSEHYLFKSDR